MTTKVSIAVTPCRRTFIQQPTARASSNVTPALSASRHALPPHLYSATRSQTSTKNSSWPRCAKAGTRLPNIIYAQDLASSLRSNKQKDGVHDSNKHSSKRSQTAPLMLKLAS